MTFHSSSAVYIPLYFILNKEIPNFIKWTGIIVANAIFLLRISIISDFVNSLNIFQAMALVEKLSGYVENSEASQAISFGYLERTFSILTFTLLYKKLVTQRRSNIIFYNCFWLYYVTFLCFYEVQVLVDRIPTLFMFSYWILYPNVITSLRYKMRQIVYAVSMAFVFMKIYAGNTNPAAKYDNVIFGIEDYRSRKLTYEKIVKMQ